MDLNVNTQNTFCLTIREKARLEYRNGAVSLSMEGCGCGRKKREVTLGILKNIKILSDSSSLEIFINDGEEVFTTRIYDSMSSLRCKMASNRGKGSVELFELKKR